MTAHRVIEALPIASLRGSIPADHWSEAVAMLAHRHAATHRLEIEWLDLGFYGARIFPPERQHLQGPHSRLSGSFYGVAETPRAAVMEAVAKWNNHLADCARWAAANERKAA